MRIWDLRRGDHDDNRASPHGGDLRSLVLSAVLEFNYIKASIAFLVLIIGPALLVGIIPSLIVTYGRVKLDVIASARYAPVVAIIGLILLVGCAMWFGRLFLAFALENFWRLHYTLVFPLFVALRECLRSIAELFPGKLATAEELDRRRRIGTVLGALILAGGGITVAATMWSSTGLQLVNIEQVRSWAVAKAMLGNAAAVLGLSTAAESLYWVWRELRFRSSVKDWAPCSSDYEGPFARVAHLSDLHVVGERYGYRMEAGTLGPRGNRCVRNALHKLGEIDESNRLNRVLVTGDVTDAGTRGEWAEFLHLLRNHPLRDRLSFVPGNHDVSIVDRHNPGRSDLPGSAGRPLRRLRVVLALDAIQGSRARVFDRKSGALGPLLKDYLRQNGRVERLQALARKGTLRGRREMEAVWEGMFPLVEEPSEADGYGLILLDSNARSHFALTNAIGVVSPSQVKALRAILRGARHTAWLILLHHQVVEYPAPSISLVDRIGLALVNAPDVLDVITPHASRCLILHGHRHRSWIGACGDVVLCSAPSSTLGSYGEEKYRGSLYVHQLAVGGEGDIRLVATERVTLPPS